MFVAYNHIFTLDLTMYTVHKSFYVSELDEHHQGIWKQTNTFNSYKQKSEKDIITEVVGKRSRFTNGRYWAQISVEFNFRYINKNLLRTYRKIYDKYKMGKLLCINTVVMS